jgi:hypothetical protein
MKVWSNKKWARHGEAHSQWKGGRSIDGKGYYKLNINLIEPQFHCMCDKSGWVLEHRYIMAVYLGRPLTRKEIIHHKDHNKSNNDVSNLELTTRGDHMRSHESWKTMRPTK